MVDSVKILLSGECVNVMIPPLKRGGRDPIFVAYFWTNLARNTKKGPTLSDKTMKLFPKHHWVGNYGN